MVEPMNISANNSMRDASGNAFQNVSSSSTSSPFFPPLLLASKSPHSSPVEQRKTTDRLQFGYDSFVDSPSSNFYENERCPTNERRRIRGPPNVSMRDVPLLKTMNQSSFSSEYSRNSFGPGKENVDYDSNADVDNNWVTIFGFRDDSQLHAILSYFSLFGHVVDKKCVVGGNWVHLKFDTRRAVHEALAQNGKKVLPDMMVGVVSSKFQCNENTQVDKNLSNHITTPSPVRSQCGSIRRLGTSPILLNTTGLSDSFVPTGNLPSKSSGYLSSVMDKIFNW